MSRLTQYALAGVALAFVAAGMLFVPRLGIAADEAIVANGLYAHGTPAYSLKIADVELPIMLTSRLGALKAWMYKGVFVFFPPRPMVMRFPMLLLGAASLWLFFELLDRTLNRRAAWIGTLLLGTDTSYLLFHAADYDHVILQLAFKLAALLLLVRFHQNPSDKNAKRDLFYAFFLLGLGLWDKAPFGWALVGLAAAGLAAFPGEIRKHLSPGNIALAGSALLIGALPLVIFNIARPLETLRGSAPQEHTGMLATVNGSALFGLLTAVERGPQPGQPNHWYQSLSIAISRWTGHPHYNVMLVFAIISVLALIFLWKSPARQPILFGVIACAGAAITQDAILMWPFHLLPIAAMLAQIPATRAMLVTVLLCGSNLAVTNQYYADLIRNGPAVRWTDAMDLLQRYLTDLHATRIVAADRGFTETMNLQGEGELPMTGIGDGRNQALEALLLDPATVFVAHTKGFAVRPQERTALEDLARREQYEEESLTTIQDRNGRPTFDVFRFRKLHL